MANTPGSLNDLYALAEDTVMQALRQQIEAMMCVAVLVLEHLTLQFHTMSPGIKQPKTSREPCALSSIVVVLGCETNVNISF